MSNVAISNLPPAIGLTGAELVPLVQAGVTKRAPAALIAQLGLASALPAALEFVIDGNGSNISSRVWGTLTVPFDGVITGATIEADQTGSIIVDVWKCTYAEYAPPAIPNASYSITGGAPMQITAGVKAVINTAPWVSELSRGDILTFSVPNTATNIQRVTASILLNRIVS